MHTVCGLRRVIRGLAFLAATTACALTTARAADPTYPDRVVRFIVPFNAGGTTDVMARKLTEALAARLKQTVIIENKPGAGGTIGAVAALAPPNDGYTVLFTSTAIVQAPLLLKNPPYDPMRDFTPVAMVCISPVVMGVPSVLGTKTLTQFLDWARAHKGEVSYASSGPGTTSHITSEELKRRAGIEATNVPYTGDSRSSIDLIANRVQFYLTTPAGLAPLAEQGKLDLLAVTGKQRLPFLPDVPTFKEQGLDGFETVGWFGVFISSQAPEEAVQKLRREITRIVTGEDYVKFLAGIKMVAPNSEPFAPQVLQTQAAWGRMIKHNNITVP